MLRAVNCMLPSPASESCKICVAIGVLDLAAVVEQYDWLLVPGMLSPYLCWCKFSWRGETVCGGMMLCFLLLV